MAAVTFPNKEEVDAALAEFSARLDAQGLPVDTSGFATQNQVEDAIDTALENAGADATAKASGAVDTANAYTDARAAAAVTSAATATATAIADHNSAPDAHGLDIANLATKAYVDAVAAGFDPSRFKQPANVVATSNVTLSGTQTIDTVALNVGDVVLAVAQTDASQNGSWVVQSGSWTRPTDFDTDGEALPGSFVFILFGTTQNAGSSYVLVTNDPISLGTTSLTWKLYQKATSYAAGSRLTLTGTTFSIADGAIDIGALATALLGGSDGNFALRKLGTSPGMGLPGDHVSVTNARTPLSHAATHEAGGPDALNPANLGIAGTNVTFSPITGVAATNVQAAIAQVQSNVTAASNTAGGKFHVVVKTAAYTAVRGDVVLVDASGGAVSITLPAVGNDQLPIIVKKVDSSTNPVLIAPPTGVMLEFTTSPYTLTQRGQSRVFGSSTAAWYSVMGDDPLSIFARLDQTNDYAGNIQTGFGFQFLSIGTQTAVIVDRLTHRGRDVGITTNTTTAATVSVQFPTTIQKGDQGSFTQEGNAPLVFSAAPGVALHHYLGHTRSGGQYACVFWRCRAVTSGVPDIILSGQTTT